MFNLKKALLFTFFIAIGILFLGCNMRYSPNSPEGAIRRELFHVNSLQSLTCTITKTDYVDKIYGQQYIVDGFVEPVTQGKIRFAYTKKNSTGKYYWTGGGSAP